MRGRSERDEIKLIYDTGYLLGIGPFPLAGGVAGAGGRRGDPGTKRSAAAVRYRMLCGLVSVFLGAWG